MTEELCERRTIHHDRLENARQLIRTYPDITSMSALFKAIGDPGRLQILIALAHEEMCVCDLAALLEVSESAASHQLRILRTMNLVKNRREGQILYYYLVDEHVTQLITIARDHVAELVQE